MRAYNPPVKRANIAGKDDATKIKLKKPATATATTAAAAACEINIDGLRWLNRSFTGSLEAYDDTDFDNTNTNVNTESVFI